MRKASTPPSSPQFGTSFKHFGDSSRDLAQFAIFLLLSVLFGLFAFEGEAQSGQILGHIGRT